MVASSTVTFQKISTIMEVANSSILNFITQKISLILYKRLNNEGSFSLYHYFLTRLNKRQFKKTTLFYTAELLILSHHLFV